ncbi:hypothetical protein AAFC00_007305 [Neodothiora populina]|uniref:RRM domain-containing protein n=1 Tax=Neodothiora populina TaxID=2781224 RepID=A0ABR3PHU2_9PEZI
MYLLRRAAVRSFSSQTTAFLAKPRTLATKTSSGSALRTQQWAVSSYQRRFASDEASPAKASTTDETVPTKPSQAEQTIAEQVKATEQKAESSIGEASSTVAETAQNAAETIKETATSAVGAAQDALSSAAAAVAPRTSRPRRDDSGKEGKILYVGNLFFEARANDIEREFSRFGNVVNCRLATDPKGLSRGFAFVEFSEASEAAEAQKNLNQQVFQGRRMAVQPHINRGAAASGERASSQRAPRPGHDNPPSKTLFIGNMSFEMTDKDLNDLFKNVANVIDVRVAIDRRTGQPRGFAHADFVDVDAATNALAELNNKEVFGRRLKVNYGVESKHRQGNEAPY